MVMYRSLPVSLASITSYSHTPARSPHAAFGPSGRLRSVQSCSELKLAVRNRRVVNLPYASLVWASKISAGSYVEPDPGSSGRISFTSVTPELFGDPPSRRVFLNVIPYRSAPLTTTWATVVLVPGS